MHTQSVAVGLPIQFRAVGPGDVERLVRAFDQLSPLSRYRRFLAPVRSLSDNDLQRFTHPDFVDHVAWGAELIGEPGRPFAGVGRWIRSHQDPALAEIAITVIDAYHRHGLGSALLRLLASSALPRGVRWFEGSVLGENWPMRSLLDNFGARAVDFDMGTYLLRLSVPTIANSPSPGHNIL